MFHGKKVSPGNLVLLVPILSLGAFPLLGVVSRVQESEEEQGDREKQEARIYLSTAYVVRPFDPTINGEGALRQRNLASIPERMIREMYVSPTIISTAFTRLSQYEGYSDLETWKCGGQRIVP